MDSVTDILIKMNDVVYVAGPMTGKDLFNYVQFYGFCGLIQKEYQCFVLNPARQQNGLTYEEYIRLALEDVEKATVMVFLDGWEKSRGAKIEMMKAIERGIRIILEDEIKNDLRYRIKVK